MIRVNDFTFNDRSNHQTNYVCIVIVAIVVITVKLLHSVLHCTYMLILVPCLRVMRSVLLEIFHGWRMLIRCVIVVHRIGDRPVKVEVADCGRKLWIDLTVTRNVRLRPCEILMVCVR